jgi:hypothetical protein
MSVSSPGAFIYSGSVFYIDLSNPKSYAGEPTTNLIPTPSVNAYPTYGNYWYTYNTNQYGSGTYFSIGTVASVSNNIVTMTSPHSLRTYDVMQPQTSGGGVSGGTNYFIKKLSSTTFCLYPYNGSQDGSQGYINISTGNHKVYDSIMLDQKVSINASGFPTMWWGAPHLPNSGLVKEIIPGGFDVDESKKTDCIRLHYIRDDGVLDGMSYGPDASVTIGSPVTTTFWTRAVTNNAVGATVSFQHYNYGGVSGADGFYYSPSLGPVGVWKKNSFTFTPTRNTLISYWFFGTGQSKYDIANIQIEQKGHATQFAVGTRSVTEGLKDLTRNYSVDLTNAGYDNSANITFNGSSNYITAYSIPDSFWYGGSWTVSAWVKFNSVSKGIDNAIIGHGALGANNGLHLAERNSRVYFGMYNNDTGGNIPLSANVWYHIVWTFDYSTKLKRIYVNGVFDTSGGAIGYSGTGSNTEIGRYPWATSYLMSGYIQTVSLHNRVLTSDEILKTFNRAKNLYGY